MQTALEQLDRMDALVKRMARFGLSGSVNDQLAEAHNIATDAERLLADRAPAGFDKALAVIQRDVPLLGYSGQRRLARDVLAAINPQ